MYRCELHHASNDQYPSPPQVLELDRICFNGLWMVEGYQREVDSLNSELIALLSGDRLVGYGCFWAIVDEAHITILAVHPDYQQGFGQLILLALLDQVHKTLVLLEVRGNAETFNTIATSLPQIARGADSKLIHTLRRCAT